MKLSIGFIAILLIMSVQFKKTQAQVDYFYKNNKGEGNGKTFGQNNIISGNNIRNRVQINGETIEEGQIGDDVAKLNNHNMNHDHRVKEKGNRDRVNSHNDHSKTIEEGTIGDKQSSKQPKETIVTTTEEPSLWQKTKNWFG